MSVRFLFSWLILSIGFIGTYSLPQQFSRSAIFLYRDYANLSTKTICADPVTSEATRRVQFTMQSPIPLTDVIGFSKNGTELQSVAVVVSAQQLDNLTRISSKSRTIMFINNDEFPHPTVAAETNIIAVSGADFRQLVLAASNGHTQVKVLQDTVQPHSTFPVVLIIILVNLFAVISLLLGSWMVHLRREKLLLDLRSRSSVFERSKFAMYIAVGAMVLVASAILLIYYFFYDFAVYLAIALFGLVSVFAISYVVAFWIKLPCGAHERKIPLKFRLRGRDFSYELPTIQLAMLPFSIAYVIVWVIYRNDPSIGWPMQSVAGVFVVVYILSSSILLPSLKMITILFSAFVIYDIFFVFITRTFSSSSHTTVTETPLVRAARSADSRSFMEAVALGTAGHSGEAIPATFRLRLRQSIGLYGCSFQDNSMLLGFGDAIIPGLLCAFLILYDSLWQIKAYRHFVASFIGYVVGIVCAFLAAMFSSIGQPALIYLCPCTLGFTVLTACIFGGKEELIKLWNGYLPTTMNPPEYVPTPEGDTDDKMTDHPVPFDVNANPERVILPQMFTGDWYGDSANGSNGNLTSKA